MGFSLPLSEVVGSNPASPISRYSGEIVLSEEIPEGWWGSCFFQRANELSSLSFLSSYIDWF
jgi:hypothetical protein